jgi:hypothetical protein
MPFAPKRCYFLGVDAFRYNKMHRLVTELPRKDDRISVPLDGDTLEKLEAMAAKDERPVARQAVALIKAAIELIEEHGFRLVEGKLRRVSIEETEELRNSTHE